MKTFTVTQNLNDILRTDVAGAKWIVNENVTINSPGTGVYCSAENVSLQIGGTVMATSQGSYGIGMDSAGMRVNIGQSGKIYANAGVSVSDNG